MQIRNAPWAALSTLESQSRSSTLSPSKVHVVSNVSVLTVSLEFFSQTTVGQMYFNFLSVSEIYMQFLKPLLLGVFSLYYPFYYYQV